MRRTIVRTGQPQQGSGCPATPQKMATTAAPQWPERHAENAAFVNAYNELIDVEGVALEEYRLF
ncbi:MAG: hypothetical protein QFF03_20940 [Pseudomonadota bacterium]|nr:hypothetical protein [Pseudomonadota bacterium]